MNIIFLIIILLVAFYFVKPTQKDEKVDLNIGKCNCN